jgi:predicted nucleic acid-binding protein
VTPEALADTSTFIAMERERRMLDNPPGRMVVSCITIGELRVGVLSASTSSEQELRLWTLQRAQRIDPLPVDRLVAYSWAELRRALRELKQRLDENDAWIAATAIAHQLPLVTQDADFTDVPGLEVIRV